MYYCLVYSFFDLRKIQVLPWFPDIDKLDVAAMTECILQSVVTQESFEKTALGKLGKALVLYMKIHLSQNLSLVLGENSTIKVIIID